MPKYAYTSSARPGVYRLYIHTLASRAGFLEVDLAEFPSYRACQDIANAIDAHCRKFYGRAAPHPARIASFKPHPDSPAAKRSKKES